MHCGALNRLPEQARPGTVVCGKCKHQLFEPRPVAIRDEQQFDRLLASPVPVLVDFWAPWCAPCRMLAPELDALARDWVGQLVIAKVNIDEQPALAERFAIRSVPTMMLFRNGALLDSIMGAMPRQALQQRLAPFLARS